MRRRLVLASIAAVITLVMVINGPVLFQSTEHRQSAAPIPENAPQVQPAGQPALAPAPAPDQYAVDDLFGGGEDTMLRTSAFRLPIDKLARRRNIAHIDQMDRFLASPSIVQLDSGRLLVLYERQASWGVSDPTTLWKIVMASDDGGSSWQRVGAPGPMQWPQIFKCASGVYVIGCERAFSHNNNLVISKMVDQAGRNWTRPMRLTQGLSVVTINTGVDVSHGRVVKSFEIIPSMNVPPMASEIVRDAVVAIRMLEGKYSWRHPPSVDLYVKDAAGFVVSTLVKVPYNPRPLFFRIQEVDHLSNRLRLRLERFTLLWQTETARIRAGMHVQIGSGANVYGGVDWVSLAISADETRDLRDPAAWRMSQLLGNPASLLSNEMRSLFDVAFRADYAVRKSILEFDNDYIKTEESSWEAGFGSLYWMEGVAIRLQDRRGSNGKLLNILRVNNDLFCDLAAITLLDDSQPDNISHTFLRYKNIPGLGIGHPAIVYDNVTDLYWMASNLNRDSTREWKQPDQPNEVNPHLHITPFSKCEIDRTTVALYYSPNVFDWVMAGIVDYHLSFGRHFTYPHMMVVDDDLLIVMRATFSPRGPHEPVSGYYNNHNSNSISFHRIINFRKYANVQWAAYEGEYTRRTRRVGSRVS